MGDRPRRSSKGGVSYREVDDNEGIEDDSDGSSQDLSDGGGDGKRRAKHKKRRKTSPPESQRPSRNRRQVNYNTALSDEDEEEEEEEVEEEELVLDGDVDHSEDEVADGDAMDVEQQSSEAPTRSEETGADDDEVKEQPAATGRPSRACRKKAMEAAAKGRSIMDSDDDEEESQPRRRIRKGGQGTKPQGKAGASKGTELMSYFKQKTAAGEMRDPSEATSMTMQASSSQSKKRASTTSRRPKVLGPSKKKPPSDDDFEEEEEPSSSDDNTGSSRGRGRKGRGKVELVPVRRSSRASSSVRTYNEEQLYKEEETRAMMEVFKAKKSSRINKAQEDEDDGEEGGEDDEDSDVMAVESDGEGSEGDEEGGDDDDEEEEEDDQPLPRILAVKKLTAAEWRDVCKDMNTKEITRGSLWIQNEEDWASNSPKLIEKYLCLWSNMSYLHVSWETEADLINCVGSRAKGTITRWTKKPVDWEQLYNQEYFDPQYLEIDRILAIEEVEEKKSDDKATGKGKGEGGSKKQQEEDDEEEEEWEQWPDTEEGKEEKVASGEMGVELEPTMDDDAQGEVKDEKEGENNGVAKEEGPSEPQSEGMKDKEKQPPNPSEGESSSVGDKVTEQSVPVVAESSGPKRYLVKWCNLGYGESTWECESDLQNKNLEAHVAAFKARQVVPEEYKQRVKKKLDSDIFNKAEHPPFKNGGQLKDYQWEAVRWMAVNWSQSRGSILADEMGLGKTVQSAAFVYCLYHFQGVTGPFLVVAPLSTIQHWYREFSGWTDMNAVVYGGLMKDREAIREYEFAFPSDDEGSSGTGRGKRKRKTTGGYKDKPKFQVLITTPEILLTDVNKLSRISWDVLVVDEAHRLKNNNSKLTVTLRDSFRFKSTLLLTGTPLQNNTEELWTLLNFVDGQAFGSLSRFMAKYGDMSTNPETLTELHGAIKPYLLRRMKDDVEKGLPPKEETIIEVELTAIQKQYYRALYEKNVGFLFANKRAVDGPSLMNLVMSLRLCCNHPFLMRGVETDIRKHYSSNKKSFKSDADLLTDCSGKLVLLDKLLPKLKQGGHRVLIFSQFKMMLDVLEDYIKDRGLTYRRIDGDVMGDKRQMAIDEYSKPDSNVFVMLLTTRAGGVGINLTAADTVIIYDSDWNPQNDVQAQARCHRIGQSKQVKVYRLVTSKTYEMQMFHRASLKLGLDQAVLHGMEREAAEASYLTAGGEKQGPPKLTKDEIENLLRHGAYDVFREDREGKSEEESLKFCESTIEDILQKKSHTITTGGANTGAIGGLSSFSKASFTVSDGVEVGVDDPDFWNKVVGINVQEAEDELPKERSCKAGRKRYTEQMVAASSSSDSEGSEGEEESESGDVGGVKWLQRVWKALREEGLRRWDQLGETKVLKSMAPEEVKTLCLSMVGAIVKRVAKKEAINAKRAKIKERNKKARQSLEAYHSQMKRSEESNGETPPPSGPPPPEVPPDPTEEDITVDDAEVRLRTIKLLSSMPIIHNALRELALKEQEKEEKEEPPKSAQEEEEEKEEQADRPVEKKEGEQEPEQQQPPKPMEVGEDDDEVVVVQREDVMEVEVTKPEGQTAAAATATTTTTTSGTTTTTTQEGASAAPTPAVATIKPKPPSSSTKTFKEPQQLFEWLSGSKLVPPAVVESEWNDFLGSTTANCLNHFHDMDIGNRMAEALDRPEEEEDRYRIDHALSSVSGPKAWWTPDLSRLLLREMHRHKFQRFLKEQYVAMQALAPEDIQSRTDWPTIPSLTKLRTDLQKAFLKCRYPPPPPPAPRPQQTMEVPIAPAHIQPASNAMRPVNAPVPVSMFFHRPQLGAGSSVGAVLAAAAAASASGGGANTTTTVGNGFRPIQPSPTLPHRHHQQQQQQQLQAPSHLFRPSAPGPVSSVRPSSFPTPTPLSSTTVVAGAGAPLRPLLPSSLLPAPSSAVALHDITNNNLHAPPFSVPQQRPIAPLTTTTTPATANPLPVNKPKPPLAHLHQQQQQAQTATLAPAPAPAAQVPPPRAALAALNGGHDPSHAVDLTSDTDDSTTRKVQALQALQQPMSQAGASTASAASPPPPQNESPVAASAPKPEKRDIRSWFGSKQQRPA